MPLTLPYPSTFSGFWVMPWFSKSLFTPSPSGMICVEQAQVSQSVAIKIRRFSPEEVGQTRPVKVCILTGTRQIHAATMQSIPAFGVIEWMMSGFSLWKVLMSLHREMKSFLREICRSIGISMHLTPWFRSFWSSGPGEESDTTS